MSDRLDGGAAAVASQATPHEQTVGAGAVGANSARPLTWRDIRGTVRRHADELLSTEAEAAALQALRVATGETDAAVLDRGAHRRHAPDRVRPRAPALRVLPS